MSTTKLANIFALSTLAILLCSFAPSQTLAVAVQANHLARQVPNHHGIARKKRSKRDGQCKPRSSTSSPADQPTSTPADQPTSTPQSSPSPNNSPSPSSTQPPNTVATNTPSTSSGTKFCVAWAMYDDSRLKDIIAPGNVFQILLWDSNPSDLVKSSGIPVSIMLWDDASDKVAAFQQAIANGGIADIRGFNEYVASIYFLSHELIRFYRVNEPTQANMDVGRAIQAWRQYVEPHHGQGFTITSPCTTSAPDGYTWMQQFYSECQDCFGVMDYQGAHWYDIHEADLEAYIEKWSQFGLPIALSEFACQVRISLFGVV